MIVRYLPSNELYHHGVKGQKWGVRKQRILLGRRRRSGLSSDSSSLSKSSSRYKRYTPEEARARNRKVTATATGIVAAGIVGSIAAYQTGTVLYNKYKKKKLSGHAIAKGREIFEASTRVVKALPKY